ncbi:hypothetical protein [Flaviflagellibacter deserti]|uniref:Uncharacterized protein n=1 Tax=Flaviflagellibacter deserti TaxID=2267266 RepID=A0ABV9Z3D1_9HYPH
MKTTTFILAATTLGLGLGPAMAGPCTTEINNLTKTLSASDAGAGPTSGTGSSAASSGQHAPTGAMGKQAEGKATSPADVRRQTQGQPTAADQAASGRAAAEPTDANAALQRAREFDRQGKEADCMTSVRQAKQLSGAK